MSKIIAIHLSKDLDNSLRNQRRTGGGRSDGPPEEFHELLTHYRLKPEPLFPDKPRDPIDCIWHATASDTEAAEIVSQLSSLPGVEGAYVKPDEGPPATP